MSDPFQRPIDLSLRKEQSDTHKCQKEIRREADPDRLDIHPPQIDADEPCENQGEKADVDGRRTTEYDGHDERQKRNDCQIHSFSFDTMISPQTVKGSKEEQG